MNLPRATRALIAVGALVCTTGSVARGADPVLDPASLGGTLERILTGSTTEAEPLLEQVDQAFDPRAVPMVLDTIYLSRAPQVSLRLFRILEQHTGESLGFDISAWWQWTWNHEPLRHPDYPAFRSRVFRLVDPKFAGYFGPDRTTRIRLDEVVWGGVRQDGIPPLRSPTMIPATGATYLQDDNVVFALVVNGDARAYPRRILAWHEMFTDTVGGVPVAGVYCTLCGAMILYETEHAGIRHELGTSGFLFRSNKLMYDRATQSLWTTLGGEPVIGPLADRGIRLARRSVVTTTWGEWRRRHPDTTVVSPDTGHSRDYAEGAAYREYFATDALMFPVPSRDERLANKDEVLGLLIAPHADQPLAISAGFLAAHPVHHDRVGTVDLVVVTDPSGANRVYQAGEVRFSAFDGDRTLTAADGSSWTLTEEALESGGTRLARLPAHRSFWFGWHAAFPHTRLVK